MMKSTAARRTTIELLEPRRLMAAGQLDAAFGNGGLVVTDILGDNRPENAQIVLPMADGRVVAIGETTVPDPTFSALSALRRIIITRHNANGTPDTTFDGDGVLILEPSPDEEGFAPRAAVLNADSSLILVGSETHGEEDFEGSIRIISHARTLRITPAGTVDASFDGADISAGFGSRMVRQNDGKIVISDYRLRGNDGTTSIVRRFNADGSLDTTFGGGDGSVDSPDLLANNGTVDLTVRASDGKIFLAAKRYDTIATITVLNPDGSPDTTAGGGDGVVEFDTTLWQFAHVVPALTGDGFYASGWRKKAGVPLSVAKLTGAGTVDPTFTSGSFPEDVDVYFSELIVQPDGKLLASSTTFDTSSFKRDPIIIRFNANGTRDTAFGAEGVFRLRSTLENNSILNDVALAVSPANTIYAAGAGSGQYMVFRVSNDATTGGGNAVTADLAPDGTLTISGTADADVISMRTEEVGNVTVIPRIFLTTNGVTREFTSTDVKRIVISAGGGRDYVDLRDLKSLGTTAAPFPVTIDGGDGNDILVGSQSNDRITGGNDEDKINGWDGDDWLSGNAQKDRIDGGLGNDSVLGNGGRDFLAGNLGNDTLFGGDQPDVLAGNDGDDSLMGEGSHDRLDGGAGRDFISGAGGNDTIYARDNAIDTVVGGLQGDDRALVDDIDELAGIETLL